MMQRAMTALAVVAAVGGAVVLAQQPASKPETKPAQPPAKGELPPGMDEHMREAMQAMKPGPEHAQLEKLAGGWVVSTTMEMPGMPRTETVGHASIKSALGGRFLQESGTGDMMGEKTEHFKMWGFNNGTKKFEATWTWTMSTSMLHMVGSSPDGGKTITWDAWYDEKPGSKEEFKCKTTLKDDDHFTVELYGGKMPDGSPGPVMTSTYTRKQW